MEGRLIVRTNSPLDQVRAFLAASHVSLAEFSESPLAANPAAQRRLREIRHFLADVERRMASPSYSQSEDVEWHADELAGVLVELSPEGYTFGPHPLDGEAWGFWLI